MTPRPRPARPPGIARRAIAIAVATALAFATGAHAGTFAVLHDFRGPEGAGPVGGLAVDGAGHVYGTAVDKGAHGGGTLFEIADGKLVVLHDFGAPGDGAHPYDDTLLLDADGTIWGTTHAGGAGGAGAIFSWRRDRGYELAYSFPASGTSGREPRAGLAKGPDGALYGSASTGGQMVCRSGVGCGTIFRFDPAHRSLTTLHVFDTDDGLSYPWSTPLVGTDGVSGTTMGVGNNGGPFSMRRDGSRFAQVAVAFGASQFASALVRAGDGSVWGTTLDDSGDTRGSLFTVDGRGEFTTRYTFSGRDGASPYGRLLSAGPYLYGTAAAGGRHDCGTVFRYARGGRAQTLHDFDCKDGNAPLAGLVADGQGNFYGTTSAGGAYQNGTVFRIRP